MSNEYLHEIRSYSCYPVFRRVVTFFTVIGYIAAGLFALYGLFAGLLSNHFSIAVVSLGIAVVVAILVAMAREVSLMLADIADATINFTGSQKDLLGVSQRIGEKVPRPADQQRA